MSIPNYTEFMMRHGECGVQAIIERLERYEGIRGNATKPLEQRWNALMQDNSAPALHTLPMAA